MQTEPAQDPDPMSAPEPAVPVTLVPTSFKKPFLGGYKHKQTEVEYHHASVQTDPKRKPSRTAIVFERETQTVIAKNKLLQTSCNAATQMCRIGLHVSDLEDRVMYPGKFLRNVLLTDDVTVFP